jgi:lipopolysaccharide exporter
VTVSSPAPPDRPAGNTLGLAARAATGLAWLFASRAIMRLLGFSSTLLMVRLLTPADFGLVALAFSITQGVELLSIFGVVDAIVRHPSPTRATYDTAFTINAIRSAVTAALIAAAAWPMARFFNEPRLTEVVAALAFATLLGGLQNIGTADFRRELKFNYDFQLRILPQLLSVVASVAVAAIFRSYWALVVGTLVDRFAANLMTYWIHPHRPRFTLSEWRDLTGFSLWSWIIGLIVLVRDRIGNFVIGRMFGMQTLGLFSITIDLAVLPLAEVVFPLSTVLFSAFSRAAHNPPETASLYLRFFGLAVLVMIPAGLGISILADPIVRLVLGEKWIEAIPLLQIAALAPPLVTLGFITRSLFEAHGLMRVTAKITFLSTTLRIVLTIVLVYELGMIGAVIAALSDSVVEQACLLVMTRRRFGISLASVARQVWRPLAGGAVMSVVLITVGPRFGWTPHEPYVFAAELLAAVLVGASTFIGTVVTVWWLSGRPDGAETDLISASRKSVLALRKRLAS